MSALELIGYKSVLNRSHVYVLIGTEAALPETLVAIYGDEMTAKTQAAKLNNTMTEAERDAFAGYPSRGVDFIVSAIKWFPPSIPGEYLDPCR